MPSATRAELLNQAILDSALDCIITMDVDGIIREFNPAAERVFSYRRADAVGKELAELIIPPILRCGLAHYLKTVVEMHGGRISASSAGLGQGATFVVVLALNGSGTAAKASERSPR
jgi:PAS domain S-box-containing protein